jgi:hypothetical protein
MFYADVLLLNSNNDDDDALSIRIRWLNLGLPTPTTACPPPMVLPAQHQIIYSVTKVLSSTCSETTLYTDERPASQLIFTQNIKNTNKLA